MKAAAGRDAGAQVRLALWCEAHGLERERVRHLAVAVLADPSNAMARGLMGLVEYGGKWRRPEAVAEAVRADVEHADLLAEYAGRRLRAAVKPEPQYKLALWCEERGLKDEARAHLATVVRLDPKHAEAWKKLGYKKVGDRWVTDAQASGEQEEKRAQGEADKRWQPRLERIKADLANHTLREPAERSMADVTDPRAAAMVWKVFVLKGDAKTDAAHLRAVQMLGQIDSASSSRFLASLAVFDRSPEVRRRAAETLRRRDPREYAALLIGMLRETIRFEVKKVGGPGSPGELYIEGKKANIKRLYSPTGVPNPQPGDRFAYDSLGRLVLVRPLYDRVSEFSKSAGRMSWEELQAILAYSAQNPSDSVNPANLQHVLAYNLEQAPRRQAALVDEQYRQLLASQQYAQFAAITNTAAMQAQAAEMETKLAGMLQHAGAGSKAPLLTQQLAGAFGPPGVALSPAMTQSILNQGRGSGQLGPTNIPFGPRTSGLGAVGDIGPGTLLSGTYTPAIYIPIGQMRADASMSARAAQGQLERDAAAIDAINAAVTRSNERPVAVLSAATGEPFVDRKAWEKWFVDQVGYAFITPEEKPTVVENVPINYQTSAVATPGIAVLSVSRVSCFGKGTSVRTLAGPRPIEDLKVGDTVLTQDTRCGRLGYRPVTVVHHNPPSATYDIKLGDDTVVSSHFHRFWVAGRGWVMARDLKAGDPVRTLGGVVKVASIEPGSVQPVFNLDVEGEADFFAGASAALVHDNTLPDLKQAPFDAPPAVAAR